MAKQKKPAAKRGQAGQTPDKKPIESYTHSDKQRSNNPPVGLVTSATDPPEPPKKTYQYDPHLDPQLVWAGKAERLSFDVSTVSLHVHERIDPKTIIAAVRSGQGGSGQGSVGSGQRGSDQGTVGSGQNKKTDHYPLTTGHSSPTGHSRQLPLFETRELNPPLRDALDFYQHPHGWTNRLVAGDSLLVMNSLLEKEGLAGKVQMIYIDPPYGIRYGSNFQPFVNRRDVKDGKEEDLSQEPETIKAFRDTWELGIHSYLSGLRDRLLLARELLHESGSVFVQISDENLHHVRELMDEVIGAENFVSLISFAKTSGLEAAGRVASRVDYLVWYGRDAKSIKYHALFNNKGIDSVKGYTWIEMEGGHRRRMTSAEAATPTTIPANARPLKPSDITKPGPGSKYEFEFEGRTYSPGGRWFGTTREGMMRLGVAGRLIPAGKNIAYVRYLDDFPFAAMTNLWNDTGVAGFAADKRYVVETTSKVIERCVLMTTDPGDLVLDPTCGSGTTAFVAEQWGRRWITCDTSRVAVTLAKQRLMTAVFDYYKLASPQDGVGGSFVYKTVPHVTLKSIANNPEIKEGMTREQIDAAIAKYADQETLYDQPQIDRTKARVTGPFTVEAVPSINVREVVSGQGSVGSAEGSVVSGQQEKTDNWPLTTGHSSDHWPLTTGPSSDNWPLTTGNSVSRYGETLRQTEWRDELARTGVRGKAGQKIEFARLEPLGGTRYLHAMGETVASGQGSVVSGQKKTTVNRPLATGHSSLTTDHSLPRLVAVSFGPEHAPLEQRQVEQAWEEARTLSPKPEILIFAAFHFDPEAAKDIDELTPEKTGLVFLKAQMNTDLLTDDLKKKRASNESFWLIGQPDVEVVSEQWLVDSSQHRVMPYDAFKKLSGLARLAEIDGLGSEDLRGDPGVPARGTVRAGKSVASGVGLGSLEHRRGAIQELHRRIQAIPRSGKGKSRRTGNPTRTVESAGVASAGNESTANRGRPGDWENAQWADGLASLEALTADHLPLTTVHYHRVALRGFDYYNPVSGKIESGDTAKIAMWLLDTDYDGRSLYPRQVFFPLSGEKDGWSRLAKNLKAEIDEELIEAYRGTVSLPFEAGKHRRVAVKIIDDRGIESLKVLVTD